MRQYIVPRSAAAAATGKVGAAGVGGSGTSTSSSSELQVLGLDKLAVVLSYKGKSLERCGKRRLGREPYLFGCHSPPIAPITFLLQTALAGRKAPAILSRFNGHRTIQRDVVCIRRRSNPLG